jgi:hypothetical protein
MAMGIFLAHFIQVRDILSYQVSLLVRASVTDGPGHERGSLLAIANLRTYVDWPDCGYFKQPMGVSISIKP